MSFFGSKLFDRRLNKLYDFAQNGILNNWGDNSSVYQSYDFVPVGAVTVNNNQVLSNVGQAKPKAKPKPKKELTPKEIYTLETLNIPEFQINCEPEYLDDQIVLLQNKLGLLPMPPKPLKRRWFGFPEVMMDVPPPMTAQESYGRQEIESMVERLSNRRKFPSAEKEFAEWPYTTSHAIADLLKKHGHLEAVNFTTMLSELPKDAVTQATKYNDLIRVICGKTGVFYLIRPTAARKEVEKRRDPILLAQSPFGFFWQILGAWDDEVKFLEEL